MGRVLIRGVKPALPAEGVADRVVDVSIAADGRIERVGPAIEPQAQEMQVDAEGAYISPAWADLHTHIYHGATDIGVRASDAGLARGVATLVDAGSAGEANVEGFLEFVTGRSTEEVYAFLNVGSIGLVACNRVSELTSVHSIDADRLLDAVDRHRSVIRGLKVRASHVILGDWGITPVRVAKQLSRIASLPLMVHVGEAPPLLDEVLDLLDEGDVVTHCFHGKRGASIGEDDRLFQAMVDAAGRGVRLDVGHGGASFSFSVAKRALDRGLVPYTISTDLHQHNIAGPVWDLGTTMSKLLNLGMPLTGVLEAVTFHPWRILGLGERAAGWLRAGTLARFTLFRIEEVSLEAPDSAGGRERLSRFILPRYTVVGTEVVEASSTGHEALRSRRDGARRENDR
ncbi:amidohydrolase/deacetylase family metallohydrolase [Limnochorda pilosa]|nr:amidohydrolase/deacetylase family metallohydrolase [Limnochorda pilosa]